MNLNEDLPRFKALVQDLSNEERNEAALVMLEGIAGACLSGKEIAEIWDPFGFHHGDLVRIGGRYCMVEWTNHETQRMGVRYAR